MAEILEKTADRFVMAVPKRFNSALKTLITTATIVVLGAGAVGFWVGRHAISQGKLMTLICDRTEPAQVDCELTERYADNTTNTTALAKIRGAKATWVEGEDDDGNTYYQCYVRLIDRQWVLYPVPLNQFDYRSPEPCSGAIQLAEQINQFIKDPKQRFSTYQEDTRVHANLPWITSGSLAGIAFLLFVGLPIFFLREERWEVDRGQRQLTRSTRSIWGCRVIRYGFQQVDRVLVEQRTDSDDDQWQSVKLVLKPNEVVTILPDAMNSPEHLQNCDQLTRAMTTIAGAKLEVQEKP